MKRGGVLTTTAHIRGTALYTLDPPLSPGVLLLNPLRSSLAESILTLKLYAPVMLFSEDIRWYIYNVYNPALAAGESSENDA